MGQVARAPWGPHQAWFKVARSAIRLTGMDAGQLRELCRSYEPFISLTEPNLDAADEGVECRACRLADPPGLSPADLTRDGQYAPRAVQSPNGIELTGVNFRARVPLYPKQSPGWLGVVGARELVQANVIENVLRVFIAHQSLRRGGIVPHSAGLVVGDRAYLFAGRSGAGKTTLTRKGHQAGAGVLSDDINLVLPGAVGYEAHAVPFTGEFGRALTDPGGRTAYPVAGLVLLERGERLHVGRLGRAVALARLLAACPFVNMEAAVSGRLFDVTTRLLARLPVVELRCRRDDGFDDIVAAVAEGLAYERAA